MSEIPKNCTECNEYKTCKSFFGARGCRYEKEITRAILARKEKHHEEET